MAKSRYVPLAPVLAYGHIRVDTTGNTQHREIDGELRRGTGLNVFFRHGSRLYGSSVRVLDTPSYCGGAFCHFGKRNYLSMLSGDMRDLRNSLPDYGQWGWSPEDIQAASLASGIVADMIRRRKTSYAANGVEESFHEDVWVKALPQTSVRLWKNYLFWNTLNCPYGDVYRRDNSLLSGFNPQAPMNFDMQHAMLNFGSAMPKPRVQVVHDIMNLNSDNVCWWSMFVYDSQTAMANARETGVVCDECGRTDPDASSGDPCPCCGDWGVYESIDRDPLSATSTTFKFDNKPPAGVAAHVEAAKETLEKVVLAKQTSNQLGMLFGNV